MNRLVRAKYSQLKKSARRRGIAFSLTRNDVYGLVHNIPAQCPCCKESLSRPGYPNSRNYPTVDRFDSKRGYEPDNVLLLCNRCNSAKGMLEDPARRIKDTHPNVQLHLVQKWMHEIWLSRCLMESYR